MRIFIYEYVTGGGCWEAATPPTAHESLLAQGRAMVQAIAADFCSLAGAEVWTTRDARLPPLHPDKCRITTIDNAGGEASVIRQFAAAADWTLLIAPETDNALARRCTLVTATGGRLLSPSSAVVSLAADKHATAQWLASHGLPVPRGTLITSRQQGISAAIAFPAVLKPPDGCGSESVRLVRKAADWSAITIDQPLRLEEYIPGLAASVAVLAGPAGNYSLPASEQRLTTDGRFTYLGGRLPLRPALDRRARQLAEAAIATLPQPRGYLGVDLVLGPASDGGGDRVIEINPRLTTSYIGLRALSQTNLAAAILAIAEGKVPDLNFQVKPLTFSAEGTVSLQLTTDN